MRDPRRATTHADDAGAKHALTRQSLTQRQVNIFKDETVIHFTNPKVQASIAANTYVVSGPSQTKKLQDLLPGIISQLGTDNLAHLKKLSQEIGTSSGAAAAAGGDDDDDDVPELVENFEAAAK